jgi:guanylate kinase
LIFIVSGPGGAGKGTLVARLLRLMPDLKLSRSWTTRARRPGEPEKAYDFVTHEEFQRRIDDGGFLEWTESASSPGHLYGTPSPGVTDSARVPESDLVPESDWVLEIDLDGARQVKAVRPEAVLILVVPPSREAQEERLRRRGDSAPNVAHRLDLGAEEERTGRQMADHVVVNDDIERAAAEVADIIRAHRKGH